MKKELDLNPTSNTDELCIGSSHNFIMYDNLQQPIHHKTFISVPRPYPSSRLHDTSSVEPWEKYTLEIVINEEPIRQARTFYCSPKKNQHLKHYQTARGTSFRGERIGQPIRKAKSLLTTKRKSAISQYNINGNIFGEQAHPPHLPPFQSFQPPALSFRTTIHRDRPAITKLNELQQAKLKGYQSLMQMRRKMTVQRQKLRDEGYVHLHSEFDDGGCREDNWARKGKVISLGYKKLCWNKSKRVNSCRSKFSETL